MRIAPFTIGRIPRILFGEGRFTEVPELVGSFGRRALIVTGARSFQASSNWENLTQSLTRAGIHWYVVEVPGEPFPELVDQAVSAHKGRGIEAVVGIGGGSAIDAAKAVAALLPSGNSVMDHLEVVGRGIPYEGPSLPCVAVPTTAGTGSEATKNAVLASRGPEGFKRSFRHEALVPTVAVVDPTLTYDCPPELTASAGMDALTQLLESYVSTDSNPFTDGLAMSGLTAARDGLLAAYENGADESARRAMAYAALASGITLAQVGLGAVHGLASPLGGFFPIPHGVACAALLVPATKVNIKALRERSPDSAALEKYAEAGAILSGAAPAGREAAWDTLIDTLSFWKERLRIPGLGAYGVEDRDLRKIAAAYSAKTNPATLMEEELAAILLDSI